MIKFLAAYFLFLAYMISYPMQVFTLGDKSGVFGVLVGLSFFLMSFNVFISRDSIKFERGKLVVGGVLVILPFAYSISYVQNPSEYYSVVLFKTVVLYLFFTVLMHRKNLVIFSQHAFSMSRNLYQPGFFASWILFGFPVMLMAYAALKNSLGSIPPDVVLDAKYFYGPFIRAGAGYVDPNALGLMVVIVSAIFIEYVSKYKSLMIFVGLMVLMLVILTFSRTSQILFASFVLFRLMKRVKNQEVMFFVAMLFVVACVFLRNHYDVVIVFFERYFNEEGESSTGDRFNQLEVFLRMLFSAGYGELIFGFGGQEAFQELAGSAMHSAPLSIFIDSGFFASLASMIFFGISIKQSLQNRIDLFRLVAIATSFVLPYIPELFFLLVFYLVIENGRQSYFGSKNKEFSA